LETGAHLGDGHARFEARVDGELGFFEIARDEQIGREAETDQGAMIFGQDADDGTRTAIEINDAADEGRIAVEVFAPETVMEDDHLVAIRWDKAASQQYGDAEGGEVVFRGIHTECPAGFAAIVEVDEGLFVLSGDLLEEAGVAEEIDDVDRGMAVTSYSDGDQRRGIPDRRFAEEEFGSEREDGSIDADAETEG
jgi:hypothetical protein